MYSFHPTPDGFVSRVSTDERSILLRLVQDVAELIADQDEPPVPPGPSELSTDPIAHLDFEPHEGEADHLDLDPALERIFPPMSISDPELAAELRGLTLGEIRRGKISNLWLVAESLREGRDGVLVRTADVANWLAALTDLRLVLASRLGIEDDESAEAVYELAVSATNDPTPAETGDDDMRLALASLYSGVTWWQESLLSALARGKERA